MPAIRWYALFFPYMFEQSGGMGAIHIRNLRSSQLGPVRSITAPLLKSRASIPSRTPVPWFPGTLFFRPCDLGGSKSGATVASKALKTRGQPRSRSARSAVASRPIGWRPIGRYVSSGPQWLDRPELDGVYKFQCLQIDGYQGDHLEAAASLSLAIAAG
jgi:hypothetical protein